MRGTPTEKAHHAHTRVRRPVRPECVPAETGRSASKGNLVDFTDHCRRNSSRDSGLPRVQKKPLGVTDTADTSKRVKGRPLNCEPVRVTPLFREKPDIAKIGRAVIAMAGELAKAKKEQEVKDENED